jgi:hypothetical protein
LAYTFSLFVYPSKDEIHYIFLILVLKRLLEIFIKLNLKKYEIYPCLEKVKNNTNLSIFTTRNKDKLEYRLQFGGESSEKLLKFAALPLAQI